MTGLDAQLTLAIEAAFANGDVIDGDQMVFARTRIRITGLQAGASYTITEPYGEHHINADGNGVINVTDDVGITPGQFGQALNGPIGPFLVWDPDVQGTPPAGFIGDPGVGHAVIGSPNNTNFFRVEGPDIASQCDPDPQITGDEILNCEQTALFNVMGRISTIAGVQVSRATYNRDGNNLMSIAVQATSQDMEESIDVDGAGLPQTLMKGDGLGRYMAILSLNTAASAPELTIRNAGDTPPSITHTIPVDAVDINQASYDTDDEVLTVQASSSDQSGVTLTAYREGGTSVLGTLADGSLSLFGVAVPPVKVVVKSSAGGEDTKQVWITGSAFPPVPLMAIASAPPFVPQGAVVNLDATSSSGDIVSYEWTMTGSTGGPTVPIDNANEAVASFVAGDAGTEYTLRLTLQDQSGATAEAEVVVTVEALSAPVANAGPDQGPSQTVVQGAAISLSADASTGATGYQWTQVGGLLVSNLQRADTANASFVLSDDQLVTFQLDVTGPGGGAASDFVTIIPLQDVIALTRAEFRNGKREWRVDGTATVLGTPAGLGNRISIWRDAAHTSLIGSADVDNLGVWTFRVQGINGPSTGNQIFVTSNRGGEISVLANVRN